MILFLGCWLSSVGWGLWDYEALYAEKFKNEKQMPSPASAFHFLRNILINRPFEQLFFYFFKYLHYNY